jgi:hypothetical protein
MTNAATIIGAKIGFWTVVNVIGRRATCQCRCGVIRVVAIDALQSGSSTSCGCAPITSAQSEALRREAEQQQRRRELRRWKPSGGK